MVERAPVIRASFVCLSIGFPLCAVIGLFKQIIFYPFSFSPFKIILSSNRTGFYDMLGQNIGIPDFIVIPSHYLDQVPTDNTGEL